MPSPFPGMDPYLEAHWLDVHTALVAASRRALNERLPEDLIARAEERVAIESDAGRSSTLGPDVRVFEGIGLPPSREDRAAVAELAPYHLVALVEPIIERFIEILDVNGERLVSVIEFVSPSNKRGKGLEAFVQRREELLSGGVNFIEIDLTRTGDWRALLRPHACPPEAVALYRAVIRLANDTIGAYLHPFPLRDPLPNVRIPLRDSEKPVELPLGMLLRQEYDYGRYGRTLDYTKVPKPELEAEDAEWADRLLREAGRRK
jgi:hypothetical protein